MTAKEFKRVFAAARSGKGTLDEAGALVGIGLHNHRVKCTVGGCAAVLRWQCLFFSNEWDTEALSTEAEYFKRVDLLD